MKWLIWQLPPWVHELILRLTGYRLVMIHEPEPDWLIPFYRYLWEKTIQKHYLIWTKRYPL